MLTAHRLRATAAGRSVQTTTGLIQVSASDARKFRTVNTSNATVTDGIMLRGVNLSQYAAEPAIEPTAAWKGQSSTTDFPVFKTLGFNTVRVGWGYGHWARQSASVFYAKLDQWVSEAKANNLYLIGTCFTLPGTGAIMSLGGYDVYEGYVNIGGEGFWGSQTRRDQLKAMWVDIATRYKNENTWAVWDLINEPSPAWADTGLLWQTYSDIITAVRATGDKHVLAVMKSATEMFPGQNSMGPILTDTQMCYEAHNYHPLMFPGTMQTNTFPGYYTDPNITQNSAAPYNDPANPKYWDWQAIKKDMTAGGMTWNDMSIAYKYLQTLPRRPFLIGEFGGGKNYPIATSAGAAAGHIRAYDDMTAHWTYHEYQSGVSSDSTRGFADPSEAAIKDAIRERVWAQPMVYPA